VRALAALLLAAVGAWLLLRRREAPQHVVVAWEDGSEIELEPPSPDRERLIAVAREALR
jgi:hypothetical protein